MAMMMMMMMMRMSIDEWMFDDIKHSVTVKKKYDDDDPDLIEIMNGKKLTIVQVTDRPKTNFHLGKLHSVIH